MRRLRVDRRVKPRSSPAMTREEVQAAVAVQSEIRRSWAGLIVQFVGMIALICLIYIVINSLTKGYYSVKLGFIAVILVLILSGLILLMH